MIKGGSAIGAVVICSAGALAGAERGDFPSDQRRVQISAIDFDLGIIEVMHYGFQSVPLDGWRFCSSDADQVQVYTGSTGLNGITLEPQDTLYIYFNNNAPNDGEPLTINRSDLGGAFAFPLSEEAYGLGLYRTPVSFGSPISIADYVQWSIGGDPDTAAATRATVAVNGGIWTAADAFVATLPGTERIELMEEEKFIEILDGPKDYRVVGGVAPCPGDADGSGGVDLADLNLVLGSFGNSVPAGTMGDTTGDGAVDLADLNAVLGAFGQPCP